MGRQFGRQQVDLRQALAMLAQGPLPTAVYASRLSETFGCSSRAAADAITVLKRGRYAEQRALPEDRRRKIYRLTLEGEQLLNHPEAARLLRHARKLLTTCPSPRARQRRARNPERSATQELKRREQLILKLSPSSRQPRTSPTPEAGERLSP